MRLPRISYKLLVGRRTTVVAAVAASAFGWVGAGPTMIIAEGSPESVLQTNLVSDLPGVAAVQDPNLVNPWGISASGGSPMWTADNNAGVSTLYRVPGANNTPVSPLALVVSIPTPVGLTGGTPTGTVFNIGSSSGAFAVSGFDKNGKPASAPALFLFASEDGTITGWNPGVNPQGFSPSQAGTYAVLARDNSGNNFTNPDPAQQTGAVYKGLAIATSTTPIVGADADSTSLLYASNFRAGTIDVYDAKFNKVTALATGAFADHGLPAGYAPFNVQALNGKIYVTYARQNATRHDDLAGAHRGFVDVFNPDGTPGLSKNAQRLISRDELNSPWGLAIAPQGFAGISAPNGDPVLLVGNFGNGLIHSYDASNGAALGRLSDPDGEPIAIDGLWALRAGNGGAGGLANSVYFTAGILGERHGVFGSLATATPGSPEGPSEQQWVQANEDVFKLDQDQLAVDIAGGAPAATIKQDARTLEADADALAAAIKAFAEDLGADAGVSASGD
jgi:uncharacterized protein (TIGR03118 family)